MPMYTFVCPDHGPWDSREPYGTESIPCRLAINSRYDICGKASGKESVYRINFGGYASTKKGEAVDYKDYRRFSEASAELDYKASRLESEGANVVTPSYYQEAKKEARKMAAAGVTADQIST